MWSRARWIRDGPGETVNRRSFGTRLGQIVETIHSGPVTVGDAIQCGDIVAVAGTVEGAGVRDPACPDRGRWPRRCRCDRLPTPQAHAPHRETSLPVPAALACAARKGRIRAAPWQAPVPRVWQRSCQSSFCLGWRRSRSSEQRSWAAGDRVDVRGFALAALAVDRGVGRGRHGGLFPAITAGR